MIDLLLNDDHDIYTTSQDLAVATVEDIVKQRLSTRLQFLLGEWFLNNEIGIPYTQIIFAQGTTLSDTYDIIRKAILDTTGVISIKSLNLTPDADGRSLRIDFEVISDNGTITDFIII